MEIDFSLNIKRLGSPQFDSPIKNIKFVRDNEKILYDINYDNVKKDIKGTPRKLLLLEMAGPRKKIYFKPEKLKVGIVTCGGLCPGINDVIRALFMQLYYQYGVNYILGFRYGYRGIYKKSIRPDKLIVPDVEPIHNLGGSMLGSSRGESDPEKIVNGLVDYGINILFTIGGDGTIRGSMAVHDEISKRGLNISIVNIPKTIDNDIPFISKSFGFQTAFSEAVESIRCAHNEARGAPNGIGIVKVMGRHSGFIAAQATLAQKDVNFVLVPEIDFDMDGKNGLLNVLKERLKKKKHALIVVAEGAGQKLFNGKEELRDKSGNKVLCDIGVYIKSRVKEFFKKSNTEVNVKYIDPSYIIRSVPATPEDSVYCGFLGEHAVHAAMSGRTRVVVGRWNENFVHLPMDIVKAGRKKIIPNESLWQSVLLSTGQPSLKN